MLASMSYQILDIIIQYVITCNNQWIDVAEDGTKFHLQDLTFKGIYAIDFYSNTTNCTFLFQNWPNLLAILVQCFSVIYTLETIKSHTSTRRSAALFNFSTSFLANYIDMTVAAGSLQCFFLYSTREEYSHTL